MTNIEIAEKVLAESQYIEVNETIIDLQSANVFRSVYNALNEQNKNKINIMRPDRAFTLCWKLIKS